MPTQKKRVTAIADEHWQAVLGYSDHVDGATNLLNGPARRLARLIEKATGEIDLSREEWNAIADSLNGKLDISDDERFGGPLGAMICSELEDADNYDELGEKWKINVPQLIKTIGEMTPLQHEAINCAVRSFWRSERKWNKFKTDWWKPSFRLAQLKEDID